MLPSVVLNVLSGRLPVFAGGHEHARAIRPAAFMLQFIPHVFLGHVVGRVTVIVLRAGLQVLEFELRITGGNPIQSLASVPPNVSQLVPLKMVLLTIIDPRRTGSGFGEQLGVQRGRGSSDIRRFPTLDLYIVPMLAEKLAIAIDAQFAVMSAGVDIGHMVPTVGSARALAIHRGEPSHFRSAQGQRRLLVAAKRAP